MKSRRRYALHLAVGSVLWTAASGQLEGNYLQVLEHGIERLLETAESVAFDCSSPLLDYLIDETLKLPDDFQTYRAMHEDYNIPDLIMTFKAYVDKGADEEERFGADGRYTHEVKERFQRSVNFWEKAGVDTTNIRCKGMHGEELSPSSGDNLENILRYLNPYWNDDKIDARAKEIRDFIETLPGKYRNPLLTFKSKVAVAQLQGQEDSILIGDGAFEFELDYCGLGEKSPEFEFAFTFAELLILREKIPEIKPRQSQALRHLRIELMQDMLGAYFLAHRFGGGFEGTDCCILHHTAASWGDCDIAAGKETGHGDTDQRECAAIFGINLATRHNLEGAIFDPKTMQVLFDSVFEDILALDSELCYHDKNHNMHEKEMPYL